MRPLWLANSILTISLALSTPTVVLAHVGHGDEFQATGGVERVEVNAETDQLLGIVVAPIDQAAAAGAGVMIPVTALVDADGKQLAFVQYENFYEPVEVTTGVTQGDLIEVTQGLSVGEKLVTQGSLSLYAESRKTQTADVSASPDASANPDASASPQTATTHAQADAQGIPHSHDAAGNLVQTGETTPQTEGFPLGRFVIAGGGMALILGAVAVIANGRKKKNTFSSKRGGF